MPRPAPPAMETIGRRMTQADIRAASAEPLVKAAMDILHGVVVEVQRADGGRAEPAKMPEPAAERTEE